MFRKSLLIGTALLACSSLTQAQNLITVPGYIASGTPPAGTAAVGFLMNCTTSTITTGTVCSPVFQVGNANNNGQTGVGGGQPVTLAAVQVPYDKCTMMQKSQFTLTTNVTAMTQLLGVSTGGAGTIINICSIKIRPTAATVLSFTEGTGTNCGTATVAVEGGSNSISPNTTAANGVSYTGIGDGDVRGNGAGTVLATHVPNDALCFQQTVAENVSITFEYVATLP
jgi:hypothetical protein